MFISVTDYTTREKILVNTDDISSIRDCKDFRVIAPISDNYAIEVSETLAELEFKMI